MPPVGFEPTISADERPYTYALDRAAVIETTKTYRMLQLNCWHSFLPFHFPASNIALKSYYLDGGLHALLSRSKNIAG